MKYFQKADLKELYQPAYRSSGEENGQVTIIGGSKLFHGAPILSLKAASRIVDMVFFASPEKSHSSVVNRLKANLSSFIWVPWDEVEAYVEKSDAVLIGPGLMRFSKETQNSKVKNQNYNLKLKSYDEVGSRTQNITKNLLLKFPHKKWVIDAGSLQTMDADWIPENAVITPNRKEFEMLFSDEIYGAPNKVRASQSTNSERDDKAGMKSLPALSKVEEIAKKHKCVIVYKGPETIVASSADTIVVNGGNPGLTKGGTGDVLAGLVVALLAKNDPFLAAGAASYVVKKAADDLYSKVGTNYNSEELANQIPQTFYELLKED